MSIPDIFRDEETGEVDIFVSPTVTGDLIEFLRDKVEVFSVTVDNAPLEDDEEADEEDSEPLDCFTFDSDLGDEEINALLGGFFKGR